MPKKVNPKVVAKGYLQKSIQKNMKLIANKSLSKFGNKGAKK